MSTFYRYDPEMHIGNIRIRVQAYRILETGVDKNQVRILAGSFENDYGVLDRNI